MKKEVLKLLEGASLEDLKALALELFKQVAKTLDDKEQEAFFLELFQSETGPVSSMVYY